MRAYLVDITSGAIESVGSGDSWEGHLQDKYDAAAAGSRHYVAAYLYCHRPKHR